MTFALNNLSVLAYANNFTLWHYATADTSVVTANYFNAASDMLRRNDLIIANIDTADTPSTIFYIVTGNTGGTVTVAAYS